MPRALLAFAFCAALLVARVRADTAPLSNDEQDVMEAAVRESKNVLSGPTRILSAVPAHGEEKAKYEEFARRLREDAKAQSPQLAEAVDDFIAKDADGSEFIFPRRPPKRLVVLTAAEERDITSAGKIDIHWALLQKFGTPALIQISRPGFDQKRNTAIIYVSESSGPMSGAGSFEVLTKVRGRWKIDKNQLIGPMWLATL
jgi:hypothetical protein